MKKIKNVNPLLFTFVLGLLVCGVGAGVTFNEVSSVTYGGVKQVGEDKVNTITEEYAMPQTDKIYYQYDNIAIKTDKKLGSDKMRIDFAVPEGAGADAEFAEVYIYDTSTHKLDKKAVTDLTVYSHGGSYSETGKKMRNILSDIKNRRIYDYELPDMQVTVYVSPENAAKFEKMPKNFSYICEEDENDYETDTAELTAAETTEQTTAEVQQND